MIHAMMSVNPSWDVFQVANGRCTLYLPSCSSRVHLIVIPTTATSALIAPCPVWTLQSLEPNAIMPRRTITAAELKAAHQRLVDQADLTAVRYRKTRYQRVTLEDIRPVITTLAIATVVAILFRCTRQQKGYRMFLDLSVCVCCCLLVRAERTLLVVLASNIAAGYLTWTILPVPNAHSDLPTHGEFLRSLSTVPPPSSEANESNSRTDCMICWDDTSGLATLVCRHEACKDCLKVMGERNQTACPLCRTPLFTTTMDDKWILLQRLRVVLNVVTLSQQISIFLYQLGRHDYWSALLDIIVLIPGVIMQIYFVLMRIIDKGDDWWREVGTMQGAPFYLSIKTAAVSLILLTASKWYALSTLD